MKVLNYDPRTKVFMAIVTCVVLTQTSSLLAILCFLLFLSVVLVLTDELNKALIMLATVFVTLFLEHLLTFLEHNIAVMFLNLLLVTVRTYLPIVMSLLLIFQTTKISEFMAAFEKIKAPSYATIPFAVFFRFIPTVQQEWQGIKKAMAFRKISMSNIFVKPVQTIEYIVVPLLASSVYILDELVAASLVRGLDSDRSRTCYLNIQYSFSDYLITLVALFFLVLVVALNLQ